MTKRRPFSLEINQQCNLPVIVFSDVFSAVCSALDKAINTTIYAAVQLAF
jgi:hypothetical protein